MSDGYYATPEENVFAELGQTAARAGVRASLRVVVEPTGGFTAAEEETLSETLERIADAMR